MALLGRSDHRGCTRMRASRIAKDLERLANHVQSDRKGGQQIGKAAPSEEREQSQGPPLLGESAAFLRATTRSKVCLFRFPSRRLDLNRGMRDSVLGEPPVDSSEHLPVSGGIGHDYMCAHGIGPGGESPDVEVVHAFDARKSSNGSSDFLNIDV